MAGKSWWGKSTNTAKSPVSESQAAQKVAELNSASVTFSNPNNQSIFLTAEKQSVDNTVDKKKDVDVEIQSLKKELEFLKFQLKESKYLLNKEKKEYEEKLQHFEKAVAANKVELSTKENELEQNKQKDIANI